MTTAKPALLFSADLVEFNATTVEISALTDEGEAWLRTFAGAGVVSVTVKKSRAYELTLELPRNGINYEVANNG